MSGRDRSEIGPSRGDLAARSPSKFGRIRLIRYLKDTSKAGGLHMEPSHKLEKTLPLWTSCFCELLRPYSAIQNAPSKAKHHLPCGARRRPQYRPSGPSGATGSIEPFCCSLLPGTSQRIRRTTRCVCDDPAKANRLVRWKSTTLPPVVQ